MSNEILLNIVLKSSKTINKIYKKKKNNDRNSDF